jgi:hypothetical protein
VCDEPRGGLESRRVRLSRLRFPGLRFWALPFLALLWLQPASTAATDPRLDQALTAIAGAASQFLVSAPNFGAQETLKQKAIVPPRRTSSSAGGNPTAVDPSQDRFKDRQILSTYALCGRGALHEVRVVYDIDGKSIVPPAKAWAELKVAALTSPEHRDLLNAEFERESLGDTAIDFGQLLLLFRKASLPKYSFTVGKTEMAGADEALVISFEQQAGAAQAGAASLHLNDAGKRSHSPLEGQIWVRTADYLPLRIMLRTAREHKKVKIRDEVRVDYEKHQGIVLLPVSVSHRRYLDDQLHAENIYQYSGWQNLETGSTKKQ